MWVGWDAADLDSLGLATSCRSVLHVSYTPWTSGYQVRVLLIVKGKSTREQT